jgi:LytR cell envelope-related transcriptional attenuator
VRVLNGTSIAGLAGRTARRLTRLGFDVSGTGDAAAASTTTVTYSGTAQADSAYTLMTALKVTPAAQGLLAEPAPQTGRPGPVTLVIGGDFAGVNAPAAAHSARGSGKAAAAGNGTAGPSAASTSPGTQATVQSRNAGASICSGLPAANPSPGVP